MHEKTQHGCHVDALSFVHEVVAYDFFGDFERCRFRLDGGESLYAAGGDPGDLDLCIFAEWGLLPGELLSLLLNLCNIKIHPHLSALCLLVFIQTGLNVHVQQDPSQHVQFLQVNCNRNQYTCTIICIFSDDPQHMHILCCWYNKKRGHQ